MLKVSRRGRVANSTAVSGVSPRSMPPARAHSFQLRAPRFAAAPPTNVTVNGAQLTKVPSGTGRTGWFVQPPQPVPSLTTPEGTLVILTRSIALNESVSVHVA